jgi:HJR/Mrr/RecB family endonuclease
MGDKGNNLYWLLARSRISVSSAAVQALAHSKISAGGSDVITIPPSSAARYATDECISHREI